MTCHNCGADNPPTFKFCQNCGTPLEAAAEPTSTPLLTSFEKSRGGSRNSSMLVFGAIFLLALACLCVCGLFFGWTYFEPGVSLASFQPAPTRTPTGGPRLTPTPAASQTEIAAGSSTSTPPTSTTSSAGTTPTAPATTFNKWTVAQAQSAFKTAGLEFANPRPMTNEDYGNVPRVAKEGLRFFLPSLGGQKGGRVYSFSTATDLQTVRQYYESGQSGAAAKPWIFVKDNILVQISGDLPESRANQYKNALNALR